MDGLVGKFERRVLDLGVSEFENFCLKHIRIMIRCIEPHGYL